MCFYCFDSLKSSQIPNSKSFISWARSQNRFMCWMPNRLIDHKIMMKSKQALGAIAIPYLQTSIIAGGHEPPLVNMTPLNTKHFSCMLCKRIERLRVHKVPKSKLPITASSNDLILIPLIKSCIITSILRHIFLCRHNYSIRIDL